MLGSIEVLVYGGTRAMVSHGYRRYFIDAASAASMKTILTQMGLVQAHWVNSDFYDTEEVWMEV